MTEYEELQALVEEYHTRLCKGRDYLMSVERNKLTVEDALSAFGWTQNGFEVMQ